ncbi:hypothetical protein NW762_006470 [Fusarium torreyae]|uniref:Forkhead box protein O n=1 Tax=Fusarium torreyae TaxID=1237075 RepID=A0A9W8VFL0_9HYPO|nr:hypothetical protein NW762_006470 [Fusarium torreyae]
MDPPFPNGGQPSSYTNIPPGHGQQSPCVPELTGMGSYYALSSGPQEQPPHLSSTGPLLRGPALSQQQENQQQQSHPALDATAYTSMASSFHYPPRSHHQVWPSPPPGPDDYDNYSYQSSPSSGSAPMSCYNSSPISPRTWSSPDFPLSQPSDSLHQQSQQNSFKNLRICTPTSTKGYPARGPRVMTPFTGGSLNQGIDNEIDGLPYSYSPATIPSSSAGALSCTSSPQEPLLGTPVHMETRQESPTCEPEYRASAEGQLGTKELKGVAVGAKCEEPYAKLLYRALMSAPDHAMTLQEIYQWFRENTDKDLKKDKTEKRPGKNAEGWQNSIRHNLSMNKGQHFRGFGRIMLEQFPRNGRPKADSGFWSQAFVKREHKETPGSASEAAEQVSTKAGDAKKPTEWMLEDWAVRNGVQSTTKYRAKDTTRRAIGSKVHHHPYDHGFSQHGSPISAKGTPGRKGDCSTNKLRLRGRHYAHETNMPPTSHHITAQPHPIRRTTTMPGMYQSQQAYEDMMMPRIERLPQTAIKQENYSPMTPDSSGHEAFGFMLPEPSLIHAHAASSSASNNHGTTAYALPSGTQNMYVGPSPCEFPYGVADVTGVYQGGGGHHSASGGVNERLMGIGPNAVYNWNGQGL